MAFDTFCVRTDARSSNSSICLSNRAEASRARAPNFLSNSSPSLAMIVSSEEILSLTSAPRRSVWPEILLASMSLSCSTPDLKSTARVDRLSARRSECTAMAEMISFVASAKFAPSALACSASESRRNWRWVSSWPFRY